MSSKDELSRLIRDKVDIDSVRIRKTAEVALRGVASPETLTPVKEHLSALLPARLKQVGLTLKNITVTTGYSGNSIEICINSTPDPSTKAGKGFMSRAASQKKIQDDASSAVEKLTHSAFALRARLALEKLTPELQKLASDFLTTTHG